MDTTVTLHKRLGHMLVEAGLLSEEDAEQAAIGAAESGRRLGDYVVEKGIVTAEALAMTLSLQLGVRFLDLLRVEIQPEALRLIPSDVCREHVLIPIETDGRSLLVVMSAPNNMQLIEDLRSMTGLEIKTAVGIPQEIRRAINMRYRPVRRSSERLGSRCHLSGQHQTGRRSKISIFSSATLPSSVQRISCSLKPSATAHRISIWNRRKTGFASGCASTACSMRRCGCQKTFRRRLSLALR